MMTSEPPNDVRTVAALLFFRKRMKDLFPAADGANTGLSAFCALLFLAQRGAAARCQEVSEFLGISPASLTLLINRLEKVELVGRHRYPGNRRAVYLALTEGGRELAGSINEILNRTETPIASQTQPEPTD
jgi:DNA-binding MarR family transcriptional regulator